jgi:hypothetical protein
MLKFLGQVVPPLFAAFVVIVGMNFFKDRDDHPPVPRSFAKVHLPWIHGRAS